jgi:hypothetical protein
MKKYLLLVLLSLALVSCKKPVKVIDPPTKAVLSLPLNNEACISGTVISTTLSSILFKWTATQNTESYEITIKNLESGAIITQSSTTTEIAVTLARNMPYSWFVTAKSSKTATTAVSDIWKLYNAGEAASAFTPFPADLTFPTMAQRVTPTAGKITLTWAGSDVDNDIINYDIYLGTTNTPALIKATQTGLTLPDVAVNAAATYYWKVVTRDSKGNTSDSGINVFYTN